MYLLYHTFGGLSRGFLKFFQKIFSELLARCCRIDCFVFPPPLDYVFIIPQANRKVNSFFKKSFRQIVQIREIDELQAYAICLLTFCVPCDIMEIRPGANVCGPPNFYAFYTKRKEVGGFPPPLLNVNFNFFPFVGKVSFNLSFISFFYFIKNFLAFCFCKIKHCFKT